jgi:nitric oxide reductase large subunit
LLTSGSLIAAPIQSADQSKVKLRASNGEFNVSTINVACLVFQNVPPEVASRFQGRKGVLFTNRDFADGEFSSLQSGTAKLSSVLFGFQTYDIGSRVAAILLRDPAPGSWQYQVKTSDGSDLLVSSIKLEKDRVVIEDSALRGFVVPVSQLLEVTRKTIERTLP